MIQSKFKAKVVHRFSDDHARCPVRSRSAGGDGLKKVDCLLESLRTYRSLPYVTEMTSGLNVTLTH